jgi:hypothetical protein
MSTIESVMERIKELPSRADVEKLKLQLGALLAFPSWRADGSSRNDTPARRVFDLIRRELEHAGLVMSKAAVHYARLPNRTDFADKAEQLVEFLGRQSPERRVQDGILRIGIGLLVADARRSVRSEGLEGEPHVSIDMICRRIHILPARLDREFPGYGEAGLLHLLVGPAR